MVLAEWNGVPLRGLLVVRHFPFFQPQPTQSNVEAKCVLKLRTRMSTPRLCVLRCRPREHELSSLPQSQVSNNSNRRGLLCKTPNLLQAFCNSLALKHNVILPKLSVVGRLGDPLGARHGH